jgi:hypothetical protein
MSDVTASTSPSVAENLAIEPGIARALPYAYARDARLVLTHHSSLGLQVLICDKTDPNALAEVGRRFGQLKPSWTKSCAVSMLRLKVRPRVWPEKLKPTSSCRV